MFGRSRAVRLEHESESWFKEFVTNFRKGGKFLGQP